VPTLAGPSVYCGKGVGCAITVGTATGCTVGRAVGLGAARKRVVDRLARERAEVGEDLAELVDALVRVRRVDERAAALGEAEARSELVDDEDHLVVLEDEVSLAPGDVRPLEPLARLHHVDAGGARGAGVDRGLGRRRVDVVSMRRGVK